MAGVVHEFISILPASARRRARLWHRYCYWKKERCVFIHVPKGAGTSINHAIYGRTLGHYEVSELRREFPGLLGSSFVFSVVRNPHDRLVSAYLFAKQGRTREMGISEPHRYTIPEFRTFESFVLEWLPYQDLSSVDHVFRPQHLYVCEGNAVAVDFLGRLEKMGEVVEVLEQRLGRKIVIGELNAVASRGDYSRYYSSETRKVVADVYARDFELLGYERE